MGSGDARRLPGDIRVLAVIREQARKLSSGPDLLARHTIPRLGGRRLPLAPAQRWLSPVKQRTLRTPGIHDNRTSTREATIAGELARDVNSQG